MTKRLFYLTILWVVSVATHAQEEFFMGCTFDESDESAPLKAELVSRDYQTMPSSYSLRKFCPKVRSQANYGTCTAWASTYAARTISEAVNHGWTDCNLITDEAFAPLFIYKQLHQEKQGCQEGTSIAKALELLKVIGAPKMRSFNVLCADYIPKSLFEEASLYKIDNYAKLFYDSRTVGQGQQPDMYIWYQATPSLQKINAIKKAISENRPVVISMECYNSFSKNWTDVWCGAFDSKRGYHAMCVVGYDDNKEGGAFEIMNSWGNKWGKNGFVWVRYADFCATTRLAYEIL